MSIDELQPGAPGKLVPYGRRPYYKPDPLPPSEDLEFDTEFYNLLTEAMFQLGKLTGTSSSDAFAPVLYTSLLRKEAMKSAEIEGADVDFNALYSTEARLQEEPGGTDDTSPSRGGSSESDSDVTKDTTEVLNYERALKAGIEALDRGEEITIDLLHSLHETLLAGVPEDRVDTDAIGEFKRVPNRAGEFIPLPPGE